MSRKKTVLVVDDEFSVRNALGFLLKDTYNIAFAAGAEEAFSYMADNPVNLVLLDIKMPKMDGLTAFRKIRKRYPGTVVIFITAHATLEMIQEALALGAYGFILKPFDSGSLVSTIDKALTMGRGATGL